MFYLAKGVLLVGLSAASYAAADACLGRSSVVLVMTGQHKLHLCEEGKTKSSYLVALGSGGVGKKKEGDNKTPVGIYPLSEMRPSAKFGNFIPVGYPTEEQRRLGYTGSAIGIHGPKRGWSWLGNLNTKVDWTQGCIALSSDREVQEIHHWMQAATGAVAVEIQ